MHENFIIVDHRGRFWTGFEFTWDGKDAEVYKTVPKAKQGIKSAEKETACYIVGSYGEVNEEAVWHSDFSVMH